MPSSLLRNPYLAPLCPSLILQPVQPRIPTPECGIPDLFFLFSVLVTIDVRTKFITEAMSHKKLL
jgi:hypothetical protein